MVELMNLLCPNTSTHVDNDTAVELISDSSKAHM